MANTIGWGQGSANNENGWGKGAENSTNDWGEVYPNSPTGETNIGVGEGVSFSLTLEEGTSFLLENNKLLILQ